MDEAVFVLEQLKLNALRQLEERIEKHLKNEFYNKVLPKVIAEVKNQITIDLINNYDELEIKIKIKGE